MTASINPDDHSYTPKNADPREPQGFVYDDPNAPPTEPESYVPEREFVLAPLFRRIGELLGIGRREEREYTYEASREATSREANARHEEEKVGLYGAAHPELAPDAQADHVHEPVQEWAQLEPTGLPEAIPVIPEPESFQTAAIHETAETSPRQGPEHSEIVPTHFEQPNAPASLQSSQEEPLQASAKSFEEVEAPALHREELEHEPAAEVQATERVPELVAARPPNQAQPQRRRPAPRQKDEIDEAIAVLREAGSKVSIAVSQAVEWLSAKEREFVRKAERSLAPAPKTRRVQSSAAARSVTKQPAQVSQSTAEGTAKPTSEAGSEASAVPKWEPLQFPALQREVSWTGQVAPAPAERRANQPADQATYSLKRGPSLVKPRRRAPFWKRIDWAAEFTPKRVAVLGGVIMAMLIVAGITFARRPASEVLPPQPRTIQPGGVTVTTHPKTPAATAPAQQSRRTAPPAKREIAPPSRRATRTVAPEEPDVVTHYYKQKPSPSKQATVAGVKRYSDMD